LKDIDDMKKASKLDIQGFLARRRVSSNKEAKRYEKKEVDPRKKIKSIN
jgi:hypothetical protein